MATNLQKGYSEKGGSIEIWNRTKDKEYVKDVLNLGAKWVDRPAGLTSAEFCDRYMVA